MYPERFIPLAITNLLEGKKVPVYTPGNQVREWLDVEDHCSAIDLILQKGKLGETYFVGPDDDSVNNLDVLKKILKLMNLGEDRIELVKDRPGHDVKYALDNSKIKKELGWKPSLRFEEGLEKTVDWYLSNEEWLNHLTSGEYKKYYEEQYTHR